MTTSLFLCDVRQKDVAISSLKIQHLTAVFRFLLQRQAKAINAKSWGPQFAPEKRALEGKAVISS